MEYQNIHIEQETATLVLFGATGDLSYRKLLPAAYNLFYLDQKEQRQRRLRVVALGRRPYSKEEYLKKIRKGIETFSRFPWEEKVFSEFVKGVDYYTMQITEEGEYKGLKDYLEAHCAKGPLLFYFAVAPKLFHPIAKGISAFAAWKERSRVIIEKPFGETLEQAHILQEEIASVFGEKAVYLIDHYLGKEMIRNIHTIRFENQIFRSCWNRDAIASVEITAAEEVGVEGRGGYYDHAGSLRDMVQNHLFQILTILAMEEPQVGDSDAFLQEQCNVLQALRPMSEDVEKSMLLAQYEGYTEEDGVDADSRTDTYSALVLEVDNERWRGVPFFIRTGKKLAKRTTYVDIRFKKTKENIDSDRLRIDIQPSEGMKVYFNIKTPGMTEEVKRVSMDFCQSCDLEAMANTPEAYERLLLAAVLGKKELFSKWEQIALSWGMVQNLTERFEEKRGPLYRYRKGSQGPNELEAFLGYYGMRPSDIEEGGVGEV